MDVGRYRLLARLGRGATCEVWRARRAGLLGRTLVVKRPLPELGGDPAFVAVLAEEARLAMRLSHPNIVRVFAVEERAGECLLAMEFLDGGDLRQLLCAQAAVDLPPPGLGALVVRELCRGLAHAHARGVVHRDVSPANVMLGRRGQVKLVDFGVARALAEITDEKTRTASLAGNLAYMAPEQLALGRIDARADLFAAGVVLYEALTGRRLYRGASDLAGMRAARRRPVAPPSSVNADVPVELDQICARAMAPDPAARFAGAAEMAAALDEVVARLGWDRRRLERAMSELRASAGAERVTRTQAPATSRRWAAGGAALVGLAAGAFWIFEARHSSTAAAAAAAIPDARRARPSEDAAPIHATPPRSPARRASPSTTNPARVSRSTRPDLPAGHLIDPFHR